jgi:hypothetical protein
MHPRACVSKGAGMLAGFTLCHTLFVFTLADDTHFLQRYAQLALPVRAAEYVAFTLAAIAVMDRCAHNGQNI